MKTPRWLRWMKWQFNNPEPHHVLRTGLDEGWMDYVDPDELERILRKWDQEFFDALDEYNKERAIAYFEIYGREEV